MLPVFVLLLFPVFVFFFNCDVKVKPSEVCPAETCGLLCLFLQINAVLARVRAPRACSCVL